LINYVEFNDKTCVSLFLFHQPAILNLLYSALVWISRANNWQIDGVGFFYRCPARFPTNSTKCTVETSLKLTNEYLLCV